MPWPERIDAELPASVPEEPETLREEIVDELSDHFRCAMDRERRFDIDEAHRRVLDRFGDPVQVARQLWLDALKGKVMSQRITLITSCVMAAACLAAVGLAWNAVQQSRQLNTAVLDKLTALANRQSEHPQPLEWMPVKVRLVNEKDGGPPAEGFTISLIGNLFGETGNIHSAELGRTTDPDGIAHFGLVRVGQHIVCITTPWGELHRREHIVRPGSEEMLQIVCPQPPATVDVTLNIANPIDDPEQQSLWVLCHFGYGGRSKWKEAGWAGLDAALSPVAVTDQGVLDLHGDLEPQLINPMTRSYRVHYLVNAAKRAPKPTLEWPEGDYRLNGIQLVNGTSELEKAGTEPLAVLGTIQYGAYGGGSGGIYSEEETLPFVLKLPEPGPRFSAKPGQPNRWEITLPEQLVDWGRSALRQRTVAESEEVE